MDIISFSEAATANSRIESFIENPDSMSGIVTVPKVIASGETITIPTGRVAVLPNVQVDGTLNIEGDVFIPSGATFGDIDNQIALKAPLLSPDFTGNPTAPTQTAGNNSTRLATTAYVDGKMVLGTAVKSTSGTAIDFTGIPSWAKKITVMFNGVSTNGASIVQLQLGSGTIKTTGYLGSFSGASGSAVASATLATGLGLTYGSGASTVSHGLAEINLLDSNLYVMSSMIGKSDAAGTNFSGSSVTLTGVLDRIRITTSNGTDAFDAGSINIMYEG